MQPVALQYRVGATGLFTNVPEGYLADATQGPSLSGLETPTSVVLPAAVDGQAEPSLSVTDVSGSALAADADYSPLALADQVIGAGATEAADVHPTIEALEKVEGMRVAFASLTVTAPTQGFKAEASATSTSSGVFYAAAGAVRQPRPRVPVSFTPRVLSGRF